MTCSKRIQTFTIALTLVFALFLSVAGTTAASTPTPGNDEHHDPTATASTPTSSVCERPATPAAAQMPQGSMMNPAMIGEIEFDQIFIDMMIPHHESAVTIAEVALERAEHEEIRQLAEDIIRSQGEEIDLLRAWRAEWYPDAPVMTMSGMMQMQDMGHMMPGMSEMMDAMNMPGMMAMDAASATQSLCSAADFDLAFLDAMIPHHQSAIMMATAAMGNAVHPELVDLAHGIVDTQHHEIEEMQAWHAQWYGPADDSTPVSNVAPIDVQVSLTEFGASASLDEFTVGTPYRFIVTNDGAAPHEFMILPATEGIGQTPMEDLHHIAVGIIPVDDLPAGATVTIDITFTEAGSYELVCALPGHYDAGMKQLITVEIEE